MSKPTLALLLTLCIALPPAHAQVVTPPAVRLDSPEASQQLLVTLPAADGTRSATYEVADPAVAAVDATGLVTPRTEGRTEVRVRSGGATLRVPVEVAGLKAPRPVSFEQEVVPILTKASCNGGGCHGKAEGQQGFKLSVFGFDPAADHAALVKESRGRRVFPASPANSLLLLKATGQVPHGGGRKVELGGLHYRRLLRWISEGAAAGGSAVSPVAALEVEPAQRTLALVVRGGCLFRVDPVHLLAGVGHLEAPCDFHPGLVPRVLPRLDLGRQRRGVGDAPVQALPGQHAQLQLGHVQPRRVLRRVMKFQSRRQPPRLLRRERLVQRPDRVRVQVVQHHPDDHGLRVPLVAQPPHLVREVLLRPPRGHRHVPPPGVRIDQHERVHPPVRPFSTTPASWPN